MNEALTGQVNSGDVFIWASYVISAITLGGVALWTIIRMMSAKKKLAMLEQASSSEKD